MHITTNEDNPYIIKPGDKSDRQARAQPWSQEREPSSPYQSNRQSSPRVEHKSAPPSPSNQPSPPWGERRPNMDYHYPYGHCRLPKPRAYTGSRYPRDNPLYHYPPSNYYPYPPHYGYRPPPRPTPHFYPSRARSTFQFAGHGEQKEWSDLWSLVERLEYENEDLKSQIGYRQSVQTEQYETMAKQKRNLELKEEKFRDQKTKLTTLEVDIAGKDEELKVLKVKIGSYRRQLDEHREVNEKLQERMEKAEKDLGDKQQEARKLQLELRREKEINRRGRLELSSANRKVGALQGELKAEKSKLWLKIREIQSKTSEETGISFQQTLAEILEKSSRQNETIDKLVMNISMQKIEFDNIINHFIVSYDRTHKELQHLYEEQREEYELKEATLDAPSRKSENYNRCIDMIRVECDQNFKQLETLTNSFLALSNQPR